MTALFVSRPELLPPGETMEEHAKWQKDEADAVQKDRDNTDPRSGGLFRGLFTSQRHSIQVIRDQEDGVDRCPMCSWELEDGECVQCGLFFDDNGELSLGDGFSGFTDIDDMSERDLSGEDIDAEMDMEDADFDYGDAADGWQGYLQEDSNYMIQRYLEHAMPAQAAFGRRRPMSHSEAGSRRSYSQSIVSDMYTDEMDTVEEEDEEELDEDSSMNDFIDDDQRESSSSTGASSTPGQTPQPTNARPRLQGRARRVVESETSSTISSIVEEEEDEEDQGPIRRGMRNRAQTRILNRANGSREPTGPPSSTSTDVSTEELEDTQALLQSEGWMLQHNGPDDMAEDDDSDGGRTTVGWDATAISNDRVRMGGSLTPTADRPRPNATIRPPSRVGNPLRRQASILSTATAHYEDGEADDDDSDFDQDGDVTMAMNSLRSRRSRAQMRNAAASTNPNSRFVNRGLSQGDPIDVDADDNSDNSTFRGRYNWRVGRMFADHLASQQRILQEVQRGGPLLDPEPRSTTPIARPRTANRNRPSPAQPFSPFMPPAPVRLRTPLMNNSSNVSFNAQGPASPPRRAPVSQNISGLVNATTTSNPERVSSLASASSSTGVPTPSSSAASSSPATSSISELPGVTAADMVDRPPSRVSARPPSATGRRNSAGFSPVYPPVTHTQLGLNIQNQIFPIHGGGNPWGAFVQQRVRNRSSRQMLQNQPSTATLRPSNSRANIRESIGSPQGLRPQPSRGGLRSQPSHRRLNSQASTRTLRASEYARPPQSPTVNTTASSQPPPRLSRLTPDEIDVRGRELVNTRRQALMSRPNNPFSRRLPNPAELPGTTNPTATPQHARTNSNESINSVASSHTATMGPPSPGLTRRRSNRHIAATPPGVLPPGAGAFQSPVTTYSNNYFRARQNAIGTGVSAFDMPLDANTRGMSPLMATSLI